ncbi:heterokaryon incompatibility protein [Colletotrichum orchidophilum]|uniref:Heterokaryon incompatibility protein n=1 Tax=Colletotrichum orchidophilum TaxID=1209926 RepID=A0A1G4BMU0_9PEZI|nr:heterokaryon incompatibility protein [Colletotrichum orchidophilum]OHF02724.1 heterokaryon incompatibility protein [Colletotrichum orchidophilum]
MRSDVIDFSRDWEPYDYGVEKDGIFWLDFKFESDAWRNGIWSDGWGARANAYQGDVVGEINDEKARLVMSDNLPSTTPYIALSYCWGPPSVIKPQLITTAATFADSQTGIPLEKMPATIRDAVVFARHMKVEYIRIDALCIIQDNSEDWAREAALMFAVYRHATLTLVAAAGDTSHLGFLQRTSAGPSIVVPFQSGRENAQVSGTSILSALNEHRTWDADYPSHMHNRAWATRAWTYQEDLISTRVLYFDNNTSYFRCQTERRLEHGTNVYANVQNWHNLLSPAPKDIPYPEGKERRESLHERWKDLIVEYTRRQLTVANDKFSALSGLARAFSSALGDEYVAGLWQRDLVREMLWQTVMQPSSPQEWRAPSWSWASSDAEIGWDLRFTLPLIQQCSIEDIQMKAAGQDSFGRLESAWIVLCAVYVPVVLRPVAQAESDQDTHCWFTYHRVELGFQSDTHLAEVLFHDDGNVKGNGSLDAVAPSGLRNDDTFKLATFSQAVNLTDVSAVVLALRCITLGVDERSGEREFSSPLFPTGLLVRGVPNNGEQRESLPVYKRLGTFRTGTLGQAEAWSSHSQSRLKLV